MTYTVRFTDFVNKGSIEVADNTVNTDLSISLVGRGSTEFGTVIAENSLHMLENFASNSAPLNPVEGQLWYDTTNNQKQLKIYDGTLWVAAGGLKKNISQPSPSASTTGDLWVDTDNQQLYLYTGSSWVLVGPDYSDGLETGAVPDTIIDTSNQSRTVVKILLNGNLVSIIASETFTPKSAISGFTKLYPGFNLTSDTAFKYWGVSYQSENLKIGNEIVPSTSVVRTDTNNILTGSLRIQNNNGILIGTNASLSLSIEGSESVVSSNISNSDMSLRVNNSGTIQTAIKIASNKNVGIDVLNPGQKLDVNGNIRTSANLIIDGITESTSFASGSVVTKGGVGIAKNLNIGGTIKASGNAIFSNITPDTNGTKNLGTEDIKWNNVYANNFYGAFTGNLTGNITGNAFRADRLTSSKLFSISGDVTASAVAFNGLNDVTLNTTISDSFIGSKTVVTSLRDDDELLINRVTGTPGVYRASKQNLLKDIPTIPIGSIIPYGGSAAPAGWFLCDGSEYSQVTYKDLFDVILFSFRAAINLSDGGLVLFAVPDFRGRFPLGLDNMGSTSANRVTDSQADTLGGFSGSEKTDIYKSNLPEHEHDLKASNGTQYYAINDFSSSVPGTADIDAPTDENNATGLPNSGGILNGGTDGAGTYRTVSGEQLGSALPVMNPFLSVNYIIYHGVF